MAISQQLHSFEIVKDRLGILPAVMPTAKSNHREPTVIPNSSPSFRGFLDTTYDALLVLEACKQGRLKPLGRRLQDKERRNIRSGDIFVFSENISGIKRWTDGRIWSPSRILGNFLIYRELDKRPEGGTSKAGQSYTAPATGATGATAGVDASADKLRERALVGSLTAAYRFKEGGLIKKTISIANLFCVSYYSLEDVLENRLPVPSTVHSLRAQHLSSEFLLYNGFRVPLIIQKDPATGYPIYAGETTETGSALPGSQGSAQASRPERGPICITPHLSPTFQQPLAPISYPQPQLPPLSIQPHPSIYVNDAPSSHGPRHKLPPLKTDLRSPSHRFSPYPSPRYSPQMASHPAPARTIYYPNPSLLSPESFPAQLYPDNAPYSPHNIISDNIVADPRGWDEETYRRSDVAYENGYTLTASPQSISLPAKSSHLFNKIPPPPTTLPSHNIKESSIRLQLEAPMARRQSHVEAAELLTHLASGMPFYDNSPPYSA